MSAKIEVKIYTDDDGFFGSESTDGIDTDASIDNYHDQLIEAVQKEYPNASVECEHVDATMKTVEVSYSGKNDIDSLSKEEEIKKEVERIIGDVYQEGSFWVVKEK